MNTKNSKTFTSDFFSVDEVIREIVVEWVEYCNPYSFRKTLVGLGERICQNPEEFKAWSQNLGHENVLTTYLSYGEVQPQRQTEIFQRLKTPRANFEGVDDLKGLMRELLQQVKNER